MRFRSVHVYIFIFLGIASMVGATSLVLVFTRKPVDKVVLPFIGQIQQDCSSIGEDGFGHVLIEGQKELRDTTLSLSNPCRVELGPAASLVITNSTIISSNLYIMSGSDASQSSITIDSSSLSGHGLHVSLDGTGSQAAIRNSILNFSSSIGLTAGSKDEDSQSNIAVASSTIQSDGINSEGIVIAATGHAEITDNTFLPGDREDGVFVLANTCKATNNRGFTGLCSISEMP